MPSVTTQLKKLDENDVLLTVGETAEICQITHWWVRKLIKSGELRAINVGGSATNTRWRIDPDDLRVFLAMRASRPRDLVATM